MIGTFANRQAISEHLDNLSPTMDPTREWFRQNASNTPPRLVRLGHSRQTRVLVYIRRPCDRIEPPLLPADYVPLELPFTSSGAAWSVEKRCTGLRNQPVAARKGRPRIPNVFPKNYGLPTPRASLRMGLRKVGPIFDSDGRLSSNIAFQLDLLQDRVSYVATWKNGACSSFEVEHGH